MDYADLKQEIDDLIAVLGDDRAIARPETERAVLAKIRLILDQTRDQRTRTARQIWGQYLPYAANLCWQLTKYEAGWEDELEYFSSENSQYWLDQAAASLEQGEIAEVKTALASLLAAARMMKRDMIGRVAILLQALDIAVEISDKKHAVLLYDEAEKLYRKHLTGGNEYTGSVWVLKIKKMGQQLAHFREKLRRYYQHSETVIVSIEADMEGDLERVIDYLQQQLVGKIKVTRRAKPIEDQDHSGAGGFRARIKITLE